MHSIRTQMLALNCSGALPNRGNTREVHRNIAVDPNLPNLSFHCSALCKDTATQSGGR